MTAQNLAAKHANGRKNRCPAAAGNKARSVAFFDENGTFCAIMDGNRFGIYVVLGFTGRRKKCGGGSTPPIAVLRPSYESEFGR
jgi:hypothetical protein